VSKANKTGLIFFPAFDWAISPSHPEREERLLYTRDQIFEEGILDDPGIVEFKPRLAEAEDVERVHFCVPNVNSQTTDAHLIAAGSALKLGDALLNREIKNGFALVRPPGHHAMRVVHGNRGFCNINNEAILVEYLRFKYGIRRVAIVDTDVHHGDGTQDIFYHDPDVLVISMHQDGRTLYPGSGFVEEAGGPGAFLKTINIPLPPGTSDEGFLEAWRRVVRPALAAFNPELVINSAGQDNHFTDPLANMKVTAAGYGKLTEELNPDLAVLEGGYAVETALPYVNLAILLALAGKDYSHVIEPQKRGIVLRQSDEVDRAIKRVIGYWEEKLGREPPGKDELFAGKGLFSRSRGIYYDTDQIYEQQRESVEYCPDCPGIYQVESRAKKGWGESSWVWCISVPLYACQACQEKAYKYWELETTSKKDAASRPDWIYLQDKKGNRYLKERG